MKRIIALSLILLIGQAQGMGTVVNNPRSVYHTATLTNPRLQSLPANVPTDTTAAGRAALPASLVAAASGYDYSGAVAKVKANVPVIIASVKVLVPKVQAIVSTAASGSWTGAVSSAIQGALDSSTREAIMNLVSKVGETINLVVTLKNSKDTTAKQDARNILSAITKDPDIQKLLDIVKGVPFVGTLASDKLNELLTDITQL